MKNYLRVGALSFLASTVLFASCDKEEGGGIDIPNIKGNVNTIEIKERQPDPKVELDTEFTYFSLTQGKILDIKEAEQKRVKNGTWHSSQVQFELMEEIVVLENVLSSSQKQKTLME